MKQQRKKVKMRTSRGFTLVETFVAITILMVTIVGPMTIAAQGLQNAFFAKDQITALYLAQESMENIREIRDTRALSVSNPVTESWGWYADLPRPCKQLKGCDFDVKKGNFERCRPNNCRIWYDSGPLGSSRGFYTHDNCDTCVQTPFTRVIHVTEIETDREALVKVEVSWQSNIFSGEKTVTLESSLLNQYDNIDPYSP